MSLLVRGKPPFACSSCCHGAARAAPAPVAWYFPLSQGRCGQSPNQGGPAAIWKVTVGHESKVSPWLCASVLLSGPGAVTCWWSCVVEQAVRCHFSCSLVTSLLWGESLPLWGSASSSLK